MKYIIYPAVFLALLFFYLSHWTDPDNARKVLEENNYSNIEITGYRFFLCSEDDFQHTGFKARSTNGSVVTGAVCSGLIFKGSTIRFD